MSSDEKRETHQDDDAARGEPKERGADAAASGGGRGPRDMQDARRGIPGKGFDAGTGYGGAGGSSAYSGESSYGGQAGYGGSTTRGAYSGGRFGRPDDPGGAFAGRGEAAAGSDSDATGQSDGQNGDAQSGDDADATGGGGSAAR